MPGTTDQPNFDYNASMNTMMRQRTAGTRMQVPNFAEQNAVAPPQNPPNIAPPQRQPAPQAAPPAQMQAQTRPPQGGQAGWTPPPGLMDPRAMQRQPGPQPQMPARPPGQPMTPQPGQMGPTPPALPGQPRPPRYTMQPPGMTARPEDYAYEPLPDRTWKMYPPGVASPPHGYQVSMPRAASTRELGQMSQELAQFMGRREQLRQSTQAPPIPGLSNANPNEVQGY